MDATIAHLAAEQHGVVAHRQVITLGLTPAKIKWRVSTGRWETMRRGVYRVGGTPPSWRQDLIAACFAAGSRAVASHRSAAVLRGIRGVEEESPEITLPRTRRLVLPEAIVHWANLPLADFTTVDAIPVTSAARTFIDLAAVVSAEVLEVALDDALRRKLVTVSWLQWRLAELGRGRRGIAVVRDLVQERAKRARIPESVLETMVFREFKRRRLPRPVIQYEVPETNGSIRVDAAYPDLKIAIEVDGWDPHDGRRPFDEDRVRRNVLTRLGWYVIHITSTDLKNGLDDVIFTLKAVIEERKGQF